MNLNLTMFAQAAAFVAFIWFTVTFVWPPLLKAIEERQRKIADGLAEAERGRSALTDAQQQADQVLAEAKSRAQEILGQAERSATARIEEARSAAKSEGERIVALARSQIDQEVESAKQQLREQVADLAVAGAEKILRREVDARAHADLLNQLKVQL